ncbi:MAG: peroxiredoxin [Euzebyales bacterium]|nr:peroxiredoxin [Euzebyales bacterium]
MASEVGDGAPDFELPDQRKRPVRLSDYRGERNVVLVFYPLSFSSVCTSELCGLRDDLGDFANDGAQLLAVSVDSPYVQRAFAEQQGYRFPLLSDFWPHGEVARRYDVFDDERGWARRGTFVIDRDGIVRWRVVTALRDPRDLDAYRRALAAVA